MSRTALLSYFVDEKTTWVFALGADGSGPLAHDTGVPPDRLRTCAQRLLIDCNALDPEYTNKQGPKQVELVARALKLPPAISSNSRKWPRDAGPNPRSLLEPKYAFTYLDELSDKLLPPSVRGLLDECAVLCVSAHGPLHGLPLHALRWDGGAYLAERFGVCYVPSVGVLRHCRERNRARRAAPPNRPRTGLVACVDAFGVQATQFEADRELLDPSCRGSVRGGGGECQALAGAAGARAATKQQVMHECARADVIHLSCHGVFASDRGSKGPLDSGIELADGRLTAREIYNLRLEADLVTLGACSTGRAQVEAGDDLLGLSRAWLYAGTPSVLVSLWNVNTASSHRLLHVFYQQWLEAGLPKWRALQVAQQALLADADNPLFRHPYHWAPFVLVGDWV